MENKELPKLQFGTFRMEPAARILKLLGGERVVARVIGTNLIAPYRWKYDKAHGGTGGRIPQKHHLPLLRYAHSQGIKLTADDFLSESSLSAACIPAADDTAVHGDAASPDPIPETSAPPPLDRVTGDRADASRGTAG